MNDHISRNELSSAQPDSKELSSTRKALDTISRQAAIDALKNVLVSEELEYAIPVLEELPSADIDLSVYSDRLWRNAYEQGKADAEAERKKGMWTTEQVAEMLANLFGDECACNCNGIDEWLPSACKYADTQCPDPKEKHGCWMQFLIQGGGGTGE